MKKVLSIAGFTVVEVVGLVVWLLLALGGRPVVGLVVLFAVLSLEHIITFFVVQGDVKRRPALPLVPIVGFSVIETLIWGAWLLEVQIGYAGFATAFLLVALLVEHTLSDNVFRNMPIFSKWVEVKTVGFTFIEVGAASAWLLLHLGGQPIYGAIVLLTGSFMEHQIAVAIARRSPWDKVTMR